MRSLRELMDLTGRVVLITGGAGHIGGAAAGGLAELGASIAILDADGPAAERTAAAIAAAHGVRAEALVVDLEDEAAVRTVSDRIEATFGRLDVLVHCAALVGTTPLEGWGVPFERQSSATWRRALEVNLTAPFVLTQACAPLLVAGGHGAVVCVGSIYGVSGPDLRLYEGTEAGNAAAYAASKGGLLQFTRWLATALAPGVRVNAVSPGGVARGQDAAFMERYIARTPLGRMATEEDIIGAIAYLASDAAAYVTGQNILVDGGWTAW